MENIFKGYIFKYHFDRNTILSTLEDHFEYEEDITTVVNWKVKDKETLH